MTVYIGLIIWIFLLWILSKGDKIYVIMPPQYRAKRASIFLTGAFLGIFLVMAFRGDSVGVDTNTYIRYFHEVANLSWKNLLTAQGRYYFSTEIGYMLLEKVVSLITSNAQWIIGISALIFLLGNYQVIERYSKHTIVALTSFLCVGAYLTSMNLMRQSIAVGLCCLCWINIQNSKYKRAIAWLVLACSFHLSAIIFVVAFTIHWIRASKKIIILTGAGIAAFAIAGSNIVYWILQFFPTYARRYGRGVWDISSANGIVILWIIMIVLVIWITISIQWDNPSNHYIFEVIIYTMIYIGLNILGLSFDGMQRAPIYFQPFLFLLFENGSVKMKSKTAQIYYLCVVCSMALLFIRASSTAQYIYTPCW